MAYLPMSRPFRKLGRSIYFIRLPMGIIRLLIQDRILKKKKIRMNRTLEKFGFQYVYGHADQWALAPV